MTNGSFLRHKKNINVNHFELLRKIRRRKTKLMDNKLDFEELLDLAEKIYGHDQFYGDEIKRNEFDCNEILALITRNGQKSNKI